MNVDWTLPITVHQTQRRYKHTRQLGPTVPVECSYLAVKCDVIHGTIFGFLGAFVSLAGLERVTSVSMAPTVMTDSFSASDAYSLYITKS